ncbi:hypothetical protein CYMTET_24837 [Cymbomonas tetramitiformis]|uniref:Methylthioribose-1-phosphate isomerase n=1 Tax=Cymbomonas tetramitiformis TaxID=36881 RepID=A0AAE0FV06_9CHLO|nr:hypothetical protein CYMTET_24837 [Cymbomonas tetramitiformis]
MPGQLEAIIYKRGSLQLLDQLKLPLASVYIDIKDCQAAWVAIKEMQVRGAPAIAITAALALAVELVSAQGKALTDAPSAVDFINKKLDYLVTSRPTAVNLMEAVNRLKAVAAHTAAGSVQDVVNGVVESAEAMLEEDLASNRQLGQYGCQALLDAVGKPSLRVLTHCNTGSLATAGYGTALGVV